MLSIDKAEVDFLVTAGMADEAEALLSTHLPRLDADLGDLGGIARLYFVACGSPLCAAQTAEQLMSACSTLPAAAFSAQDFVDHTPYAVDERTLVVAISDSGTTQEVVDAVTTAADRGARTLAVVKRAGTPVADAAQHVLAYEGGSIWTLHLLAAYHLVARLVAAHGGHPTTDAVLADLPRVPDVLRHLVASTEERSRELGVRAAQWPFIYTVSAGNLLPLGYKEGIITMLEFTWTHGCALNAAEFRHGPLEVVEPGVHYVVLVGRDGSRATAQRALGFIQRHTEDVIVFDAEDVASGLHPALDPLTLFVPLEFFYYYLSLAKDHNPDDRRYYGGKAEY